MQHVAMTMSSSHINYMTVKLDQILFNQMYYFRVWTLMVRILKC